MLLLALLLQMQSSGLGSAPGYWQQHVSYEIDASLDEPAGALRGTQVLVYRNRSPDTLITLSFHLYLNAFRPGSRWADRDSLERRRRFNDLREPDFGFNHVRDVRIMGEPVAPLYPFAPDSTIVRFGLPRPLPPGDSLVAELEWDARPSTVPRRQGRRGRAFDFAQWYPRVVAYDRHGWQEHPLYPAGEFYGEFGDFTVTLDVAEDQVVGATGVPVCGDPGWERANRNPDRPVDYRREHYPALAAVVGPETCAPRGPGRKTIIWRAEDVHHFALSMRPDYRYEGGAVGAVAVHVLYQPGDEPDWGGGVAVSRTERALRWLEDLFGPYPWPQVTNVHRLEGGGTEFPMMIMDGSAEQGLIVHELGHNYLMGILANNEWREGWLDEGLTSFQTTLFFSDSALGTRHSPLGADSAYARDEREILEWDLDGWSEPVSLAGEHYRDFATYGTMIYTRGELFFHQLREIVGPDPMRRILRAYYQRWQLKHVDEAAFRAVAEEVSGRDLSTFFAQWLHGTVRYDYSVGRVRTRRRAAGDGSSWVTRVEVRRRDPGIFPVDVVVRSREDSAVARANGSAEREWVEVETRGRPREVVIDPRARSHDWNLLNNRRTRSFLGWSAPRGRADLHVDRVFSTRTHRDRTALAFLPTAWHNDAGGLMVGVRLRSNYLGRFNDLVYEHSIATRRCCESGGPTFHNWYLRFANPTWLFAPRTRIAAEGFRVEGRQGASLSVDRQRRGHLGDGATTSFGASIRWVATYDLDYVDVAEYDNAGTVEAEVQARSADARGPWRVAGRLSLGGGVEYRNEGAGTATESRYDAQPYVRGFAEATARRALGSDASLAVRVSGGWVAAKRDPVRQRWFSVAGADPYERLRNPFIRSRDALLTGDFHFHAPGGGNVRGLVPSVAVTKLAALNVEVDRAVLRRPGGAIGREVRLAAFGDLAWTDGFFSATAGSDVAGDLGIGVRVTHRIGQTTFVTRFDFPFLVSHPDRAVGADPTDRSHVAFRWTVGIAPAF